MRTLFLLCLFIFTIVLSGGCQRGEEKGTNRSRLLMGTVVEITVLGQPEDKAHRAIAAAFQEMARIEALLSSTIETSEISRFSQTSRELTVSQETAQIVALGLKIQKASGGAFDMGLGRLKKLWALDSKNPQIPSDVQISQALSGIGPEAIKLKGQTLSKTDPHLTIDLGGIAKGYAVDKAIEVLKMAGVSHASVNAGGDIRLLGDRLGRPWRLGVQHPRDSKNILGTLNLADVAVVTSGDYERCIEKDGKRYHHLFDPATGKPAGKCRSVTVIAPGAALADALSTAVFVLGPEKGLRLLGSLPEAEGLIVSEDGSIRTSPKFKEVAVWSPR